MKCHFCGKPVPPESERKPSETVKGAFVICENCGLLDVPKDTALEILRKGVDPKCA